MKYEIKDIVFDGKNKYDPKLYWDLYRIYDAYNDVFKNNKLVSLYLANALACNTGVLCFNQIIKDDLEITKEVEELLDYKTLLLYVILFGNLDNNLHKKVVDTKNLEQLKEIYNYEEILNKYNNAKGSGQKFNYDYLSKLPVHIKEDVTRYLELCKNFIPKNIYEQIDNEKTFSYGFIRENIYNQLKEFYNELEKWLMNPIGSDNKYSLKIFRCDPLGNIHDGVFNPKLENDNYILKSLKYQIIFKNSRILSNEIDKYDDLETIEGYCVYSIKRTNDNRIEVCIEFLEGTIILECDSIIEQTNFDNMCFGKFKDVKFDVKREENKFILESDSQIIEFNNYEMWDWDIRFLKEVNELTGIFCYMNILFNNSKKLHYNLQFKEGSIDFKCDSVDIIDK